MSQNSATRRSVVLKHRPTGAPRREDFEIREDAIPQVAPDQVVTRTLWLSIDPYMRGRLREQQLYAQPVNPGDVMTGETVGEVIASAHADFVPGDVVVGARGWQTHSVSPGSQLVKLPRHGAPLSAYLGVLGMPGATAYRGISEICQPKKGETVVVSAASGAVGSVAGQLAKRAGARVLATASSDERLLALKPLGLDHGINYKKDDVVQTVMSLTDKKGVNLVVDPVGGSTLQGSILSLGYRGRVSMVGRAGREPMKVDVQSLMGGNRSLSGVFLGAEIGTDRAYNNIQRLMNDVAKGELKVIIDKTFPLSEAAAAHAYIESRKAVGRVLMVP